MLFIILYTLISADFPVCDQAEGQFQPCLSTFNDLYYVFWADHRNGMSVCGTRVNSDGTVIDSTGHFIYYGYTMVDVGVAHDDQNLLVVFRYGC